MLYSFVDNTKSCQVFYNEGRQVCHADLSCLCKKIIMVLVTI